MLLETIHTQTHTFSSILLLLLLFMSECTDSLLKYPLNQQNQSFCSRSIYIFSCLFFFLFYQGHYYKYRFKKL
jgi:TRAP-type mannitol/chloroaromatic compound transport system permease small subunit